MLRTLNRWLEVNRWVGDAIIAGVLLVVILIGYFTSGQRAELVVSAILILPLFARRALPRTVTVVIALLCVWQLTVVSGPILGDVAVVIVVHAAAAHVRERWWGIATWAAAVCGAGLGAVLWFGADAPGLAMVGFAAGFGAVSAAYLLGARQRDQREHVEEQLAALEERNRLLAVERDQRAEMAAARERTTIARELHDIVAHSLTVIVVQADGAAAAVRAAPNRADIAPMVLDTIADTSREALAEMRRLVGVLRSGAAPDASAVSSSRSGPGSGTGPGSGSGSGPVPAVGDPPVVYAPSPGVPDLAALVEQVTGTGLAVTLTVSGRRRPLPPALGLTVYRIVQEGLTNVLRHGGPAASAWVELRFDTTHLELTVTDDGRGAAASPGVFGDEGAGGHGLVGMRERVRVHGGTIVAGPRQGGGFGVSATLPLPQVAAGSAAGADVPPGAGSGVIAPAVDGPP
jgi:signal transduction histidine kinase